MNYISVGDLIKNGEIEIRTGPFGTQLKASEYISGGIPVINVRNIGYAEINLNKLETVSYDTAQRLNCHRLQEGDIVFGRKGAVDRHTYITAEESGWIQGSDCIRMRVLGNRLNPQFLSYYFLTSGHKAFMLTMCSHGTTMASLNQKILEQIRIPLFSIDMQDKAVAILEKTDAKRKLNARINDNLAA